MGTKLAELFYKKQYWERKRNNLYDQILRDYHSSFLWFSFIILQLSLSYANIKVNWVERSELTFIIWMTFSMISFFFFIIILRNGFNCYYELPRYRQKIDQIDHQIIEALKNNT